MIAPLSILRNGYAPRRLMTFLACAFVLLSPLMLQDGAAEIARPEAMAIVETACNNIPAAGAHTERHPDVQVAVVLDLPPATAHAAPTDMRTRAAAEIPYRIQAPLLYTETVTARI